MLALTDHSLHKGDNSIYALLRELRKDPCCAALDVASRGFDRNSSFFFGQTTDRLYAAPVDAGFGFSPGGAAFTQNTRQVGLNDYDVVLLRLPPPVTLSFWTFLSEVYPAAQMINQPLGIHESATKSFLLRFKEVCPPMQLCGSAAEVREFAGKFPIVLKPLRDYGGNGIIRIAGKKAWLGLEEIDYQEFLRTLGGYSSEYLGMQFLKNVYQGDKRIIVVNGRLIGAALRFPPPGSWLCNAAKGGSAKASQPNEEELDIADRINPVLRELGVIMYGFDTLVNDEGRRVLSEINTMSIGGLAPLEELSGKPVVREAARTIWEYVKEEMYGKSND